MGLQRSLDCLNAFIKKWGLTVNCQKTKIIIFHGGRPLCKVKFTVGATAIDIASEYIPRYDLGICFLYFWLLKSVMKTLAQKSGEGTAYFQKLPKFK